MRVVILGATGPSGILLIEEALTAKHIIVVYARSPQKLPAHLNKHPDTTIIKGELEDPKALDTALTGADAVLSALGPSCGNPSGTRSAYKDIVAVGEVIRACEDIDWTIVRVPFLKDEKNREVLAGYIGDGGAGAGYTLARLGFAVFVVRELEKGEWIKQAPLITSA